MECVPTLSVAVENVVCISAGSLPEIGIGCKTPDPRALFPSKKVTVPVAPQQTEADRVTACPNAEGLGLLVSVTVGVFAITICISVAEDGAYLPSPL